MHRISKGVTTDVQIHINSTQFIRNEIGVSNDFLEIRRAIVMSYYLDTYLCSYFLSVQLYPNVSSDSKKSTYYILLAGSSLNPPLIQTQEAGMSPIPEFFSLCLLFLLPSFLLLHRKVQIHQGNTFILLLFHLVQYLPTSISSLEMWQQILAEGVSHVCMYGLS